MTATRNPRLALQLYTLRDLHLPFDALLAAAAAAGYDGVETVGDHGVDAAQAAAALAEHGLEACSSHVPLETLEIDTAGVCAYNLGIGNDVLVVPWLPPERRGHDAASWRALGGELGDLARRCSDCGARLLYHNHDFELAASGGRSGLAWLMEGAGEALGLEPDLGWMQRAGEDPTRYLDAFAGRCPRVHVKDLAPPGEHLDEDGWADIGSGTMDWPNLLPACWRAGAEWLIVEHDAPRDPLTTARRSAAAIRTEWSRSGQDTA